MKFSHQFPCQCGGTHLFQTYGEDEWSVAVCSLCQKSSSLSDPLSVSVTAERLLYRCAQELSSGDYTLSILIGTIAVESYLTKLFLKFKKIGKLKSTHAWPTRDEEKAWETEYKRYRGFKLFADFVSKAMTGDTFDEFIRGNTGAANAFGGVLDVRAVSARDFIQTELFERRNRIAHSGFVDSTRQEAELCRTLAIATVRVFDDMDRAKYGVT